MDTENYMMSFKTHLLCKWCHPYHILNLLMAWMESAVSVWTGKVKSLLFNKTESFWKKMTQDKPLTNYTGRARGLMNILEEDRQRQNRLWVNTCPTPGWGRTGTLALLTEMVTKNKQKPGCGQPPALGRGLTVPCSLDSVRTWSRTPGPCLQGVDPPLWQPVFWPKCLGRGFPPTSPPAEPVPSSNSDSDSSAPPSLESLTGPESGYEAFSSSNTEWIHTYIHLIHMPIFHNSVQH